MSCGTFVLFQEPLRQTRTVNMGLGLILGYPAYFQSILNIFSLLYHTKGPNLRTDIGAGSVEQITLEMRFMNLLIQ